MYTVYKHKVLPRNYGAKRANIRLGKYPRDTRLQLFIINRQPSTSFIYPFRGFRHLLAIGRYSRLQLPGHSAAVAIRIGVSGR